MTAFSTFRELNGRFEIWSTLTVDDTVGVCVFTSDVPPRTSIFSLRAPTSRVAFTSRGVPARTWTLVKTAVLKP